MEPFRKTEIKGVFTVDAQFGLGKTLAPPGQDNAPSNDVSDGIRIATTPPPRELDYPEGGREGWLVVFGSFCAMMCVFGVINTAAVFQSYFSENQLRDYTASEIGWIFSLYLFIVYFVGILVGPVFDRHGPRLLVAAGSLLLTASMFLLSISSGEQI
jgi:hypothetical protein